jgi:hypothetical protein
MIVNKSKYLGIALLSFGIWLRAPSAHAEQVHYVGVHPIPVADDGAQVFCHIQVPHVHVYKPAKAKKDVRYRVEGDTYHFVGDPVALGYDGPKYSYYGHHPVMVDIGAHVDVDVGEFDDEYCYLDGPHFHGYEPSDQATFEFKGDAYWYVGKYPQAYRKHKKRYQPINEVYAPLVYERPVVVVEARPVAYVGPIVEVHVPGVVVETPHAHADVEIVVPTPSVRIEVGLPGVSIGHHHDNGLHLGHRKYKKRKHKKYKRGKKHH